MTQALLEKAESEDTRICKVEGKPFTGIKPGLVKEQGETKIMMVHGVGDHIPGYSTQFLENLARELKLNSRSGHSKNITLVTPLFPDQSVGNLRITHLLNEDTGEKLTFYELTWSEISRPEKALLSFDNSGDYDFRRARINSMLKKFSNDTTPDPIIYLGKSRQLILAAFAQSFCWMATQYWQDLPREGKHVCQGLGDAHADKLKYDDYVVISHSLGSRITIDGFQRIADMLVNQEKYFISQPDEKLRTTLKTVATSKAIEVLRDKHIPVFMLSNQLPVLQLGRELPEVIGQKAAYCKPEGVHYTERMLSETSIIAFSDPNDLLSYEIPKEFSEKYLDSRLCPDITNVTINVSKIIEAFNIKGFANPLDAHVGYTNDVRVVALIANGIGNPNTSPLIKERCEFTKIGD
ncbi:hypothetical protein [Nitrosomonas sp. Is37]|uniref:hypothetical protein n=1 Tax=Nitrosomonas sp. Is37 TaxID=3080535 RepID=UPI00294AFD0D|nr:hypothetical protein [Nitrosomonas sp. Is37]MDV6343924.1 hypothetical protein [Nitrosomonas sp. Is37]